MQQFTDRGLLETNIQKLWHLLVDEQDKDITILVCGAPGNGKSALTWMLAEWCAANIEPVTFDWQDVAFTHNQWIANEQDQLDKYAVSWYDEGYNTFYLRNAMTNENKEGKSHLNQYRFKHHLRFINFQDIANIERDLLFSQEIGVDALLRCVQQGWLWAYSQSSIQDIDISKDNGRKDVDWPDPDFRDGWPDPAERWPEKWKQYEQVNEQKVKEGEEGYEADNEMTIKEMAKAVKKRRDYFMNEYQGREYIDHELIEVEFEVGGRISKKVKKKVEADLGL